ncbi:MAG: SDR family NAD(P)-dependent oxidoreductase [Microbacteriaceae bacterium]|nr:SDR family NAD(P)-dependent oxidoreductase [Microbacteriaceae bacterium]
MIIGVGPGLGAALARTFARAGHDLTLLSRSTTTGEQLIDELAPSGGAVRADVVDLADEHNIRLALTRAQDALGPIAVLIVNGARYSAGRARDVEAQELATDFATNVIGATVACRAVLPGMIAAGSGTVLLTGGGAALYPSASTPSLSITKAGLRAYAYSLHDDLRGTGVHATTITIEGGIGSRPHFAAERIAQTYLDLHRQDPSEWTAELEYRDPPVAAG